MAHTQKMMVESMVGASMKLTRTWLADLVTNKLTEAGVTPTTEMAAAIVQHVLSGSGEDFTWSDGEDAPDTMQHLSLEFTDADLAEFHRKQDELYKLFPSIIENASTEAASSTFRNLKSRWPEQYAFECIEHAGFQSRLEERWGRALDHLRLLYSISLQIGHDTLRRHRRSRAKGPRYLRSVLIRLHARACQVTAEIITLLENGFADGAMARWRTLHEINVVAFVISEFGEAIAERYVIHESVEAKRAADLHSVIRVPAGDEPIPKREIRRIAKSYDDALKKFGKEFASEYGWAAHHLNNPNPRFNHLEAAAGRAALRSHYKMASYNVHASSKGIFFKLGTLDPSGLIAGASNAGLTEPGCNTADALTAMNMLVLGPRWRFEQIVGMNAIVLVRDAACRAFLRADRKLLREEAEIARRATVKRTGKDERSRDNRGH